jgi:hypothetical protein
MAFTNEQKTRNNMKNGILAAIILIALVGFIIAAYHYSIIMKVFVGLAIGWSVYFVWWTIKLILDMFK